MSELPQGWAEAELPLVCTKITDGTHHSPVNLPDGEFRYVTAKNIRPWGLDLSDISYVDAKTHQEIYSRCPVEKDDVLYIKDGATTGLAVVNPLDEPFSMLSSVALLKPNRQALESGYLKHWLNSPVTLSMMLDKMTGTAIRRLTLTTIAAQQIPLPPFAEQRRIVAKVDGLSACTARARKELDRIPTLIARYKQRLLASIFERLGRGCHISHLGDIACFVTSGSRGWAQYYSESGDMFVRVGNVKRTDITLDLNDIQHVRPPPSAEGLRTKLEKNDLLVTITADLGRIGVFESEDKAYVNQHVALVRLWEPDQARYVAWFLASEQGQALLQRNTRGATKAGLGLDDIREVEVPLPTFEEQAEIVRRIESAFGWLDRMAADHAAAARLLPKLDAAILAKAFRGELVPQDPNDEPASALLERIRAEREAEIQKPKMRRGRPRQNIYAQSDGRVGHDAGYGAPNRRVSNPKKGSSMPKTRQDDNVKDKPYLASLLKSTRHEDVQSLFRAADLPVADFYKQLAWEIEKGHIVDDPEELKAA